MLALGGGIRSVMNEEIQRMAAELDGPAREFLTTTATVTFSDNQDHRYGATANLPDNFERLLSAGVTDNTGKILSDAERILEWGEWITMVANPRHRGTLERPLFVVRREAV
jgi:hypothetical protein